MDIKKFKQKAYRRKKILSAFLKKFDKKFIPQITKISVPIDKQVWAEIDCLSCANCCKTMTPTFTKADMERISAHLGMTPKELFDKYLAYDDEGKDIVNSTTPCQWLNLKDNKCSIYEVRPADCAGFPHHTKKRLDLYNHVLEQNLNKCPATFSFVEKLKKEVEDKFVW